MENLTKLDIEELQLSELCWGPSDPEPTNPPVLTIS